MAGLLSHYSLFPNLCTGVSRETTNNRTCWIYKLCGSTRIDKNQMSMLHVCSTTQLQWGIGFGGRLGYSVLTQDPMQMGIKVKGRRLCFTYLGLAII